MSRTSSTISVQERRALFSGLMGNSIEYYEFAVYGLAAALVFKDIFFPNFSATAGTLLSLATFAIAFVARPLGGLVFGHFGDKLGRKGALIASLSLMGGATFCIGLLPTYDQIGVWAPIVLVFLRTIQGFSVGGEYSGSVLMAIEHAHPGRRGFFGALISSGLGWGTLLANFVFLLITQLPDNQLMSWGWRIPFLVSAVLVVVCAIIRLRLDESPEFKVARKSDVISKLPLTDLLRKHGWRVLAVTLLIPGSGIVYYVGSVFSLTFASSEGLSTETFLTATLLVNFVMIVFMPLFGWLTDIFNRRIILLSSYVLMAVATWIWFVLINTGNNVLIIVGFLILFIPHSACYAAQPATMAHAFSAEVRYTGMALANNGGSLIGGALSPIIAIFLLNSTGSWISIALYVTAANVIAFIAAIVVRERFVGVELQPETAGRDVTFAVGDPRPGSSSISTSRRQ